MKVLIIGNNSFIGSSIKSYLSKKYKVSSKSYSKAISLNKNILNNFDWVINCASNKKYIKNKYNEKFDFDLLIAKKIKNTNTRQIFLSTRKVYTPKENIKENSRLNPRCNYSKNKAITEKKLLDILDNRILILRISNLIGLNNKHSKRKLHKTFIDIFFEFINKDIIFKNDNLYKDFLSMKTFNLIINKLMAKKKFGIFNVSIGKKVYLNQIINWLNFYNQKKSQIKYKILKKNNVDCFYLNNKKLINSIKINSTLSDLENECKTISKKYFCKNG